MGVICVRQTKACEAKKYLKSLREAKNNKCLLCPGMIPDATECANLCVYIKITFGPIIYLPAPRCKQNYFINV